MATIDVRLRRIDAKIVYYGPGLSGKTTNLLDIHRRMPADRRGQLRSLATDEERTLFFDFVPVAPIHIGGWDLRFHLYSVPGQEHFARTRRAILGGADGVVFVADAAPDRQEANRASLNELGEFLDAYGHPLDGTAFVLQLNKMDLSEAVAEADLLSALNTDARPAVVAMAVQGTGVAETLRTISRQVAQRL
ncbi:MAG: ADP-ribosylation factor-like protein [Thermomicrobiales bacterium]